MANKLLSIFLLVFLPITFSLSQPQQKQRVLVLTDIENEPDDAQSLVRFLVYSNQFDVEGLVATTSTHLRDKTAEWRIKEIVTAYGKVRDNLLKHEEGFPTEEYLHSVTKKGIPKYGLDGVGPGNDSHGSDWLIQVVDKDDPRPVWVTVWGGANVLAQALWKVRQTRTEAELEQFVSKIRVYTISDQDNSAYWIRTEFPDLFYIVSPGENYRHATWSGISGEPWYRIIFRSRYHQSTKPLATGKYYGKPRAAGCGVPGGGIRYGRRYPQLSQLDQQWPKQPETPGLGWLGWPL